MDNYPPSTNIAPAHAEKTPPYTPENHRQSNHYVSRPGVFRRAPWMALLAPLLGISSGVASVAIAVISNHHDTTWKIQPSVLLGFFAGLSTAVLVVALSSGVSITWWRAALDPAGQQWRNSTTSGTMGASRSTPWLGGRHVNKIAVSSILVAISGIAYSPLLPRASRIESQTSSSNITMS